MRRQEEELPGLTPENAAILKAWLQSREALRPPVLPAPTTTQMVRYLSGTLPIEEARAIERSLVSHPEARGHLRQVRAALNRLQIQPWADVAEQARQESADSEVTKEWLERVSTQAAAMPQARAWWLSQGWSAVRRQAAEGAAEAQAAWTAFLAFGEQLRLGLQQPRLAQARGGAEDRPVVAGRLPAGGRVEVLHAAITEDGALQVTIALRDGNNRPLSGEEIPAHLALVFEGRAWPVASTVGEQDRYEWMIPDAGAALDLPAGQLPPGCLQITFGEPAAPASAERQILLAEVRDAAGQPVPAPPARIELPEAPRWEAGKLMVALQLPAVTYAAYADYQLHLDFRAAPLGWQRLGTWPLRAWGEAAPICLIIPFPGGPEGMLPDASGLRATLQAPA
ncbi:MAG TPA: hypothetical protein VFA07_05845 [Chthonomonadaceae bacterium]|nr:hypothetical protein [Chthonomonadaceae bacterium]